MQAMLIEDDPTTRARAASALTRAGFEVTVAGSVDAAKAAARRGIVDVLVMSERVGGRLAHDVALLAELRNPGLGTILLADRTAEEADEIFELLPSLHAVLGRGTPARTLARLALAAARWQGHEPAVSTPATTVSAKAAAEAPDRPVEGPPAAQSRASATTAVMPPPHPAPARVPSFLRLAGLALGSRVEELVPPVDRVPDAGHAAAPHRLLPPSAPARRLHLA